MLASIYANTATNGWVSPYMPKAGGTFTGAVTGITDLTTTGNTILGNAQGDTLNVAAGAIAVNAAGNVTIAAPSSGVSLFVNGSARATNGIYFDAGAYIIAPSSDALSLAAGGAARLSIGVSGNVTIANPTSGVGLTVSGGGIAVTGTSALAAVTGTTASFSSTLGVTGASTLAALGATTGTFSGAVSSPSFTAAAQVNSPGVLFTPTAEPAGTEGLVYYDSGTKKLRCYNGTTWNDLF